MGVLTLASSQGSNLRRAKRCRAPLPLQALAYLFSWPFLLRKRKKQEELPGAWRKGNVGSYG